MRAGSKHANLLNLGDIHHDITCVCFKQTQSFAKSYTEILKKNVAGFFTKVLLNRYVDYWYILSQIQD